MLTVLAIGSNDGIIRMGPTLDFGKDSALIQTVHEGEKSLGFSMAVPQSCFTKPPKSGSSVMGFMILAVVDTPKHAGLLDDLGPEAAHGRFVTPEPFPDVMNKLVDRLEDIEDPVIQVSVVGFEVKARTAADCSVSQKAD